MQNIPFQFKIPVCNFPNGDCFLQFPDRIFKVNSRLIYKFTGIKIGVSQTMSFGHNSYGMEILLNLIHFNKLIMQGNEEIWNLYELGIYFNCKKFQDEILKYIDSSPNDRILLWFVDMVSIERNNKTIMNEQWFKDIYNILFKLITEDISEYEPLKNFFLIYPATQIKLFSKCRALPKKVALDYIEKFCNKYTEFLTIPFSIKAESMSDVDVLQAFIDNKSVNAPKDIKNLFIKKENKTKTANFDQIQKIMEENMEMEEQLKKKDAEIASLKKKLETNAKNEVKETQKQQKPVVDIQKEKRLTTEIQNLKNEIKTITETNKKKMKENSQEITALKSQIEGLKKSEEEMKENYKKAVSIAENLQNSDKENKYIKMQDKRLKEEYEQMKKAKSDMERRYKAMERKYSDHKRDIELLEAQLNEQREKERLRSNSESLQSLFNNEFVKALREQNFNVLKDNSALKTKLIDARAELNKFSAADRAVADKLIAQIDSMNNIIGLMDQYNQKTNELRSINVEKSRSEEELREQIKNMSYSLNKYIADIESLEEENERMKIVIQNTDINKAKKISQENALLTRRVAELEEGLKKANTTIELLRFGPDDEEDDSIVKPRDFLDNITLAAQFGSFESVKYLVKTRPGCVNERSNKGYYPIHHAAVYNHYSIAKYLLNHGSTVNAAIKKSQETPLIFAARNGHIEMCRLLLKFNANPLLHDAIGYTAKDYAIQDCNQPLIELLQEAEQKVVSNARPLLGGYGYPYNYF